MKVLRSTARLPVPDLRWQQGIHADLGAGANPRNPLRCEQVLAVDILQHAPFAETTECRYVRVEVGSRLPFDDSSLDSVSAWDFLEHLPRHSQRRDGTTVNLFIAMMNDIYRVLKPGGLFNGVTPCFPAPGTFVDPTHVNPIAEGTLDYFAGPCHARTLGYGFDGAFEVLVAGWLPYEHALWATREPQRRHVADPWPLANGVGLAQRIQDHARSALHLLGHRPRTEHVLWLLRRADAPET